MGHVKVERWPWAWQVTSETGAVAAQGRPTLCPCVCSDSLYKKMLKHKSIPNVLRRAEG